MCGDISGFVPSVGVGGGNQRVCLWFLMEFGTGTRVKY